MASDREAALKAAREYLSEWIAACYADCEEQAIANTGKTLALKALADLIRLRELLAKIEALKWVCLVVHESNLEEIKDEIAWLEKESG